MKIDAIAEDVSPLTLTAARAEFDADLTYLDTAAFGLPPRRSWMTLQQALVQWRAATADAVAYDVPVPVAAARSAYAHLVGADPPRWRWAVRYRCSPGSSRPTCLAAARC